MLAVIAASLVACRDRGQPSAASSQRTEPVRPAPTAAPASYKVTMPSSDAQAAMAIDAGAAPAELRGASGAGFDAAWRAWAAQHDAAIRARLAAGDEDSIVNLWQFGTSFTARPRVSDQGLRTLRSGETPEDVIIGRLDDLVAALANPGGNERLRFAREVLERQHIDVTQPAGQEAARLYLVKVRDRGIAEHERYRQTLARASRQRADTVFSTVYRERGLSSDTSLSVDYALDRSLERAAAAGQIPPRSVRRVAIVGPGLDFTDKGEGYDFYPPQTIQPFAVIDSLRRLDLAAAGLELVTLDLSPRVNQHLVAARERASAGQPYALQLPLAADWPGHQWRPELVAFWQQWGGRVGESIEPIPPPSPDVRIRAVRVTPEVVSAITPRDLNIVVERLAPLAADQRFDLVVATNVLVYYDAFEQRLALSNIAAMLAPRGLLVTNYRMSPAAAFESQPVLISQLPFDREGNGDTVYGHRRR